MTLGEYISDYRQEHNLSLRRFSAMVGLSATYVSSIEKGVGTTGAVTKPTLSVYKSVASATGLTLTELLQLCEDDTVIINEQSPAPANADERLLLDLFRSLPESDRTMVFQMIRAALSSKGLL